MQRNRVLTIGFLLAGVVQMAAAQPVRVESSSAAYPLSSALVTEFARGKAPAASILLGESGSAQTLRRLCAGEVDIATAARPIVREEVTRCQSAAIEFVELPVAFDAIVVVVNPRNTFVSAMTVDELRKVWTVEAQGKLRRWKQLDARYPDTPIKLYAPEPRAERSNYFNAAVLGPDGEARRDVTGSADDDLLAQAVARDENALGYVPLAYYLENRRRLKAVPISRSSGSPAVTPSAAAIAKGEYQPLSRPLFLYVSVKALQRQELKAFVEFYLAQAPRVAAQMNYVPLEERTYQLARARFQQQTAGSAWGGRIPVGLTLDALHKRLAPL